MMNEGFEAYSANRSIRVMGPHERARFAPDAWGHLMRLSRSGILNTVELEHIIERALFQVDGRISAGDIRMVLTDAGVDDGGDPETPATQH